MDLFQDLNVTRYLLPCARLTGQTENLLCDQGIAAVLATVSHNPVLAIVGDRAGRWANMSSEKQRFGTGDMPWRKASWTSGDHIAS
jgi:hypothetical protein